MKSVEKIIPSGRQYIYFFNEYKIYQKYPTTAQKFGFHCNPTGLL
jgi:hypothetical protein